ncbi:hypothetical protein KAR48_11855 [bacterium]|nr:hypothetical protein [bacterium]
MIEFRQDDFKDLEFRFVGPSRGGRVTAVSGVAQTPGTYYMGATGGGMWKTVDYGQSWHNISDGYFSTPSIGSIAVAASAPDRIVVGTGSDGIRSNVITGKGVYISDDAGESWTFAGLPEAGQIGAVLIDPQDEEKIFIAALGHAFGPNHERGIFRTDDGGRHWEHVLFISDTTGAVDLEFAPDNSSCIYASIWRAERKPWTIISGGLEGGVYRSLDGGTSWEKLCNGLPSGITGKSDLAVSADDAHRLYVLIEAQHGLGGLYRSDDSGDSFRLVSTFAPILDRPFYYCNIDADPQNADIVYASATRFWKSVDAGKTWKRRDTPHGDNHDLWIDPADSGLMIQANDGGANVSRDGGKTWSSQYNQPTAELYQVNVDSRFPYWLYGGQQDNSTIRLPSLPPYNPAIGPLGYWQAVGGCETGPAVPKPGDPDIVYANCKGRFGRYNHRTGQEKQYYVGAMNLYGHNPKDLPYRFQRVSPIIVSLHNSDVIYHASQYVHMTTDEGLTWKTISPDLTAFEADKQVISGSPVTRDITGEEFYSCLYALAESPLEKGVLWAGANDGPIHLTRNGGRSWQKITPPDLEPGGRVQTIEASPHQKGKAYACVLRYQLDDWRPHVYRTADYGQSWIEITDGLPVDHPVRVVREDPRRPGLLYAGTEFGVFISFDDGSHWHAFQRNLPVTPVTDIKIVGDDLVLSTMGRGFWILYDVTPLRQWDFRGNSRLFKPSVAVRMRYRTRRRSQADPDYPLPGAVINYWLADSMAVPLVLEIFSDKGRLIRQISSDRVNGDVCEPDLESGMVNLTAAGTQELPAHKGLNRFTWDMRHAGAWNEKTNRSGRGGPFVVPGKYRLRLSSGELQQECVLEVIIDPRVADDGISIGSLKEQRDLQIQINRLASRAALLCSLIQGKLDEGNSDALLPILNLLKTSDQIYPQPMLLDQIRYLGSMLTRADQRPGRDAYTRLNELESIYSKLLREYRLRRLPESEGKCL